jgi:hypothetical protein
MTQSNPFSGISRVQADGRGSYIPVGTHHLRLAQFSCELSTNPQARPGTYVVTANLIVLASMPPAPVPGQPPPAHPPAPVQPGRQLDRVLILCPEVGSSKADLDQRERNLREAKAFTMALLGFHSHQGEEFDAFCLAQGVTQEVLFQHVTGATNPLANHECLCEAVQITLKNGSPFVRTDWHPVVKG